MDNSKNSINNDKSLCLYCDKTFSNVNDQGNHVERDHKTVLNKSKGSLRKSERITKNLCTENSPFAACFYCNNKKLIKSEDLDSLFQHLLAAHKDIYFGCKCKTRLYDKVSLANHKKNCELGGSSDGSSKNSDEKSSEKRKSSKSLQAKGSNDIKCDTLLDINSPTAANVSSSNHSVKTLPTNAINKKSDRSNAKNSNSKNVVNSNDKRNNHNNSNKKSKISNISSSSSSTSSNSSSSKAVDEYTIPLTRQKLKEPTTTPTKHSRSSSTTSSSSNKKSQKNGRSSSTINEVKNASSLHASSSSTSSSPSKVQRTKTTKVISHHNSQNSSELTEIVQRNDTQSTEFDEDFYKNISYNIRVNLNSFIDGKIDRLQLSRPVFDRISVSEADDGKQPNEIPNHDEKEIHEATNFELSTPFPALLTAEQYGFGDSYPKSKRQITKNSWKWRWDLIKKYKYVNEGGKIVKKVKQITTGLKDLSQLDMWTQLSMRSRYENLNSQNETTTAEFDEGLNDSLSTRMIKTQNIEQLNSILDKRLMPEINIEQLQQTLVKEELVEADEYPENNYLIDDESEKQESDLFNLFKLARIDSTTLSNPALSGEWARPRCFVCIECGQEFDLMKSLTDHKNSEHPYVVSTHYEVVGRENLEHKLYKNLFLPKKALHAKVNGNSKLLSINSDSKSNEASTTSSENSSNLSDQKEKECSKCMKTIKYSNDIDVYRHILDCIEDRVWMQAKRRNKYRRSRRKTKKNVKKTRLLNDQKKSTSSPTRKDVLEGDIPIQSNINPPTPKDDKKPTNPIVKGKTETYVSDGKSNNDGMNIKSFFRVSKTTPNLPQKIVVQMIEMQQNNNINSSLRQSLRSSTKKASESPEKCTGTTTDFEENKVIEESVEAHAKEETIKSEESMSSPIANGGKINFPSALTALQIPDSDRTKSLTSPAISTSSSLVSPTSSSVPKKKKKLNDCIAMLTCKIQEKLGVNFFENSTAEILPISDTMPACKKEEVVLNPLHKPLPSPTIINNENLIKVPDVPQSSFSVPEQVEVIDLSIKKKPNEDQEVPVSGNQSTKEEETKSSDNCHEFIPECEENVKLESISEPEAKSRETNEIKDLETCNQSQEKLDKVEKTQQETEMETLKLENLAESFKISISKDRIPNLNEILQNNTSVTTVNKLTISESERRAFEEQKNRIMQILNKTKKTPAKKAVRKPPPKKTAAKKNSRQQSIKELLIVENEKKSEEVPKEPETKNNETELELSIEPENRNENSSEKNELEVKEDTQKKSEEPMVDKTSNEPVKTKPAKVLFKFPDFDSDEELVKVTDSKKKPPVVKQKVQDAKQKVPGVNEKVLNSKDPVLDKALNEPIKAKPARVLIKFPDSDSDEGLIKVSDSKKKAPVIRQKAQVKQKVSDNKEKTPDDHEKELEIIEKEPETIETHSQGPKKVSDCKPNASSSKQKFPDIDEKVKNKKPDNKKILEDVMEKPIEPPVDKTIQTKIEQAIKTTNRIRCRRLSVVVDPIIHLAPFSQSNRKIRLTNNSQQNGFYDLLTNDQLFNTIKPHLKDEIKKTVTKAANKSAKSIQSAIKEVKAVAAKAVSDLVKEKEQLKDASSTKTPKSKTKAKGSKRRRPAAKKNKGKKNVKTKPKKQVDKPIESAPSPKKTPAKVTLTLKTTRSSLPESKPEDLESVQKIEIDDKPVAIGRRSTIKETTTQNAEETLKNSSTSVTSLEETKVHPELSEQLISKKSTKAAKTKASPKTKVASKTKPNLIKEQVEPIEIIEPPSPVSILTKMQETKIMEVFEGKPDEKLSMDVSLSSDTSNENDIPLAKLISIEKEKIQNDDAGLKIKENQNLLKNNEIQKVPQEQKSKKDDEPARALETERKPTPILEAVPDVIIPKKKAPQKKSQSKAPSKSRFKAQNKTVKDIEDAIPAEEKKSIIEEVKEEILIISKRVIRESEKEIPTVEEKVKTEEKTPKKSKENKMKQMEVSQLEKENVDKLEIFNINEDSFFNDDNDADEKINDLVNNIINSSELVDSETEKIDHVKNLDESQTESSCLICKRTFKNEKVLDKHNLTSTHLFKVRRREKRIAEQKEKELKKLSNSKESSEKELKPSENHTGTASSEENKIFRTKGALKTFENILAYPSSRASDTFDQSKDFKPLIAESSPDLKKLDAFDFDDDKSEDLSRKDKIFDSLFSNIENKLQAAAAAAAANPAPPSQKFAFPTLTPHDSEVESSSTSWDLKHDADIEWDADNHEINQPSLASAIKEKFPKKPSVKINKSKETAISIPTKSLIMGKIFKKHRDREKQKTPQADAPNNKPGIKNSLDEIFDHLKNSAEIDDKVLTCPSPKTLLKNSGGTFSPHSSHSNDMLETASQSNNSNNINNNVYPKKAVHSSSSSSSSDKSCAASSKENKTEEKLPKSTKAPSVVSQNDDDGEDGIGKRKSRRRCAIKTKTFAETWSSDEYEELHDTNDIISIINEIEKRESINKKRKVSKSESHFVDNNLSKNEAPVETNHKSNASILKSSNESTVESKKLTQPVEKTDKKKSVQLQFRPSDIFSKEKSVNTVRKRRMSSLKDGHKSDEETFTATKDLKPLKPALSMLKKRRMSCFVPSSIFNDNPKPQINNNKTVSNKSCTVEISNKVKVDKEIESSPLIENPNEKSSGKNHKKILSTVCNNHSNTATTATVNVGTTSKKKVQKHRKRPRNKVKNIAYDSDSDFELNLSKKSKASAFSDSYSEEEEDEFEATHNSKINVTSQSSLAKTSNINESAMSKEPKLLPNDLNVVATTTPAKAAIPEDINDPTQSACNRTKRHSSEKLYYWSSSSDSDVEPGDTAGGENEDSMIPQQPEQHGWIVGDSHKKLVTLLAHAKIKNKIN